MSVLLSGRRLPGGGDRKIRPPLIMLEGPTPKTVPSSKTAVRKIAKRYKALAALRDWAGIMARGTNEKIDLHAIAKSHGLTRRMLMEILKKDSQLQDEVFGGMKIEAKIAVTFALNEAVKVLSDPDSPGAMKKQWADYCAKLAEVGGYSKRNAPPIVIANLIPQLPEVLKTVPHKVIDVKVVKLEDLTENA